MLSSLLLRKNKKLRMDELIEIYKKTLIQLHVDSKSDEEIDKMAREIIESRPDKETLRKSIGFAYYSGMVSEEEIEKFKKQYDVEINYPKNIEEIKFTGSFSNSDKDIALKSICLPLNLNYSNSNSKTIQISE